ncbi:hypothetical protein [Nitrosovibrio sp. Nv6]|uniref:hypothetical protein n=1 Tax=Nitrosovibrio sp. Nv6 TaxID=1855340 RepID=UPI0008AF2514|nr:hypothetical protein [Nitrosovibrio sp. Nv6]SEP30932.1 hypothetical protein SAMN05216316_2349 [Nitrosovibrio sp. Nv6]
MDKPEPTPSYDRLQKLLAIPERQRTEAQWDEINELEITLTPINRAITSERNVRRKPVPAPAEQFKPRDGAQGTQGAQGTLGKRPLKKLRKRPKPNTP